jgi:hypothetical protein
MIRVKRECLKGVKKEVERKHLIWRLDLLPGEDYSQPNSPVQSTSRYRGKGDRDWRLRDSSDPGPPHLQVRKRISFSPRARKKAHADAKFRRKEEPMRTEMVIKERWILDGGDRGFIYGAMQYCFIYFLYLCVLE